MVCMNYVVGSALISVFGVHWSSIETWKSCPKYLYVPGVLRPRLHYAGVKQIRHKTVSISFLVQTKSQFTLCRYKMSTMGLRGFAKAYALICQIIASISIHIRRCSNHHLRYAFE